MCGGPSEEQKQAAASQKELAGVTTQYAREQMDRDSSAQTERDTFARERMKGLPYFGQEADYASSSFNKSAAPARAAQRRRLSGFGSDLPSGFAEASRSRLDTGLAREFDSRLLQLMAENENYKAGGAQTLGAGLNPLGFTQAGMGGNSSIMNAPLKNEFWSNVVGGLIRGGSSVASAYAG